MSFQYGSFGLTEGWKGVEVPSGALERDELNSTIVAFSNM